MSTAEQATAKQDRYADLRARAVAATTSREASALAALRSSLREETAEARASDDHGRVVRQIGRLARLIADIDDARLTGWVEVLQMDLNDTLDEIETREDRAEQQTPRAGVPERIFAHVRTHPSVRTKEIALALSVSPQQVSRATSELKSQGLLVEHKDPSDARGKLFTVCA